MNGLAQLTAILPSSTAPYLEQATSIYDAYVGYFEFIGVFLTLFFIGSTIYFIMTTGYAKYYVSRFEEVALKRNLNKRRSIRGWQEIKRHQFAGDENSLKIALIEADKLLDEALRLAGYSGETLGERLKKITEVEMPDIQLIWEAHKLRNKLAHETNFHLSREIGEKALSIYEKTFKDLGLLE